MTGEIFWLTATLTTTALYSYPYVIHRSSKLGPKRALGNPAPGDDLEMDAWAQRAKRAHANACENLVLFAPAVLAVQLLNLNSPLTAMACMVYFWARLAHYLIYIAGLPLARTIAHVIGSLALVLLLLRLFGVV